jgi:E3 ubiquitin-protein ligase SHPRH
VLALPEGDKCLIFSQWEDMLDIVAAALKTNSVQTARLGPQGKLDAALDLFKRVAAVRALLLPLARGANGINLTAAQVRASQGMDVNGVWN